MLGFYPLVKGHTIRYELGRLNVWAALGCGGFFIWAQRIPKGHIGPKSILLLLEIRAPPRDLWV